MQKLCHNDICEMVNSVLRILSEGAEAKTDGDRIRYSINTSEKDKDNLGGTGIDTRIFGKKSDILHGDGTANKRIKSLSDNAIILRTKVALAQYALDCVKNNEMPNLGIVKKGMERLGLSPEQETNGRGRSFYGYFLDYVKGVISADEFSEWASKIIRNNQTISSAYDEKVSRLDNYDDDDYAFRYNRMHVPGTDVEVIALFSFNDFNHSDAMKHGKFRATAKHGLAADTIKSLSNGAQAAAKKDKGISIEYDNGVAPDIMNNFSLDDKTLSGETGHFKKQFGVGDENYTSIAQFMDKSVMYAASVLNEVGFKPDVIVAAPSSSKYNKYYCTNLSRKLGVNFFSDFFEKAEYTDVTLEDEERMRKDGFSDADINDFKRKLKPIIIRSTIHTIMKPAKDFFKAHESEFADIISKFGRQSVETTICNLLSQFMGHRFNSAQNSSSYELYRLCKSYLLDQDIRRKYRSINAMVYKILLSKEFRSEINGVLSAIFNGVKKYAYLLDSGKGIKFEYDEKAVKIVGIEKRYRPYLHGAYLVKNKYLNQETRMFINSLTNANILIFDDDMNSGGTFKLCIDAINAVVPEVDKYGRKSNVNLLCLANAYSYGGR